jgi:ribonuclease HII
MLRPYHIKNRIEAGCDEAGRGCLAGPVVAAAVILPKRFNHKDLNDSKKISEGKRNVLRPIIETKALAWGVGVVWNEEIDEINILNASFLAMHRAIEQLSFLPEALLIDGNRFNPYKDIPYDCMIKGDGRFRSIAAASVLAKTHRDEIMTSLALDYPEFDWLGNKGYPTKKHRAAIRQFGTTKYHRISFRLLPED